MALAEEIIVQKNVPAEMRDGTTLVADVYRPAGTGEYPVLLTRLPYGKDQSVNTSYMHPMKAAQHGYMVVIQDVRGRFGSEGEWNPSVNEFEDGYDTVEWAARLPGSNGRVGMYGASYFGMTQWQAAIMKPPSLKSMAPGITWGNYLNGVHMRRGVRERGLRFYWTQATLAPDPLLRKYRQDPEELGKQLPALVGVIDNIPEEYGILPLKGLPDPGGVVPYMFDALAHGITSPIWEYLNIDGRYENVEVPTFHIGCWYEVFLMGENRWRSFDEWPVPGSREEHWYLHTGGVLSRENPSGSPPDEYDYDPKNPVPVIGGALLMPQIYRAGAKDQRPNEERSDVLVYTSEVLEEDYTVIGAVYATLFAASSAPDTDFVARLVDVYPDGRAIGVTDGLIRASARESYPAPGVIKPTRPTMIEPGEVYEYTIDLWATGITFKAGHRIRVEVTSSCFPRWDRNLNTGEDTYY